MSDCVVNENDMARCVRKALKEYFKDLDGEKPCCGMYDMVIDCVEKPLIEIGCSFLPHEVRLQFGVLYGVARKGSIGYISLS